MKEKVPRRHNGDRRCQFRDSDTGLACITILCSYNPGPNCFAHTAGSLRRSWATEHVMRDTPTPSAEAVITRLRELGVKIDQPERMAA